MLYFDYTEIGRKIISSYDSLWVKGVENARAVLSTLIAGTISLTVFSFSMVMIVLNQASSNFSPRVIPGLITDRSNQIVLGIYIGTIIYCLLLLHNIGLADSSTKLPLFGIFIGEVLGVICLSMFVFFIHSISQAIQIDQIIERIYKKTLKQINAEEDSKDSKSTEISTKDWENFKSISSGYFRKIDENNLLEISEENDFVIEIIPEIGDFIHKGDDLFRLNKKNVGDNLRKKILDNFIFHEEELINENFIYGFKQISEVAVKALSPGINDPGTALKAINQLSDLFSKYLLRKRKKYFYDNHHEIRIIQNEKSFDELLFRFLTPILTYGKKDILIVEKLLVTLKFLLEKCSVNDEDYLALINFISKILIEADSEIRNEFDRNKINEIIKSINISSNNNQIKLLSVN